MICVKERWFGLPDLASDLKMSTLIKANIVQDCGRCSPDNRPHALTYINTINILKTQNVCLFIHSPPSSVLLSSSDADLLCPQLSVWFWRKWENNMTFNPRAEHYDLESRRLLWPTLTHAKVVPWFVGCSRWFLGCCEWLLGCWILINK